MSRMGQSYRVGDDGVAVIRPRKSIGTFNGDACRVASGSSKLVFGMITTVRNDLSLAMDPRRMTQVDDSLFTLEFPPGIQVEDQIRGRHR